MTTNYLVYGDYIRQHEAVLDKGEPVEVEMMSQNDKVWVKARVILSQKPTTGAEPVVLLGPYGQTYDEGRYYIKILEILPEKEME